MPWTNQGGGGPWGTALTLIGSAAIYFLNRKEKADIAAKTEPFNKDYLIAAGIRPEIAYLECVGELKLIAELIEARGIAGMREAISNTAELSAHLGGGRVVDASVRQRMADILKEIREGRFANELAAEESAAYPRLNDARASAREALLERTYQSLKKSDS